MIWRRRSRMWSRGLVLDLASVQEDQWHLSASRVCLAEVILDRYSGVQKSPAFQQPTMIIHTSSSRAFEMFYSH